MIIDFLIVLHFVNSRAEPMIPDEHDEVNLSEFDPEANRRMGGMMHGHDDDDDAHGHGPGVSCATQ